MSNAQYTNVLTNILKYIKRGMLIMKILNTTMFIKSILILKRLFWIQAYNFELYEIIHEES